MWLLPPASRGSWMKGRRGDKGKLALYRRDEPRLYPSRPHASRLVQRTQATTAARSQQRDGLDAEERRVRSAERGAEYRRGCTLPWSRFRLTMWVRGRASEMAAGEAREGRRLSDQDRFVHVPFEQ